MTFNKDTSSTSGASARQREMQAEKNERWRRCPSTHCERRQECASPSDCTVKGVQAEKESDANFVELLYSIAPDVSAEIGQRFGQDIGRVVLWRVRDAIERALARRSAAIPARAEEVERARSSVEWLANNAAGMSLSDWDFHSNRILTALGTDHYRAALSAAPPLSDSEAYRAGQAAERERREGESLASFVERLDQQNVASLLAGSKPVPPLTDERIANLYAGAGYNANDVRQARNVLVEVLDAYCVVRRATTPSAQGSDSYLDEIEQTISDCEEYFDNRADAEIDQDGTHPNREMVLQNYCYEALQVVKMLRTSLADAECRGMVRAAKIAEAKSVACNEHIALRHAISVAIRTAAAALPEAASAVPRTAVLEHKWKPESETSACGQLAWLHGLGDTFKALIDYVDELERRAIPEQREDGWQPIATAPKDGTPILISNGEEVKIGAWYHAQPQYGGYTHWRLLPPAPEPQR